MKTSTVHVSKMDAEFLAESRVRECINVTIVFAILEVIFISLFFFARFKNKTTNGWDFYLMVPAFLCCYGIISLNICEFQSQHINSQRRSYAHLQYRYYTEELDAIWAH